MKYKTLFRLSLKVVGVYLSIQSILWLPRLGATIWSWFVAPDQWIPSQSFVSELITDSIYPAGLLAFGLYLLLGGKLITRLAIPDKG